jgi:hypothetical protein
VNDASHHAVILFTRYPEPGRTKTRLIPTLGAEGAARLHREMTELLVLRIKPGVALGEFGLVVCHGGASTGTMRRWLGPRIEYQPQGDGDLGERMAQAFQARFALGARKVVMIGADCPGVTTAVLTQAFGALDHHPVVFGPAQDGGYYLVGLSRPRPELFTGIAWGEATVLRDSAARARQLGLDPELLSTLPDVDRPEDLPWWEETRREASTLAVIIPTLNEAANLRDTLERVTREQPEEVLVADGGSTDGTLEIARQCGARVLQTPCGRARQMNAAAAAATAELLLFLHADTWPPEGYAKIIRARLSRATVAAGAFRFALREPVPARRFLEGLVAARCRWLRNPFGDQGLFVRRPLFEAIGGFADWPILEDLDVIQRLRRHGAIALASERALTSSRRWLQHGVWQTFAVNQLVVLGYHGGVSRERLARFYRNASK